MRSFNFIRIVALSLFGMGAVLATGSVANAQSGWGYNQNHGRTVAQHREDRNIDRDDRGRQTSWYTSNNYNRYDQDRDDRNSNGYTYYGQRSYNNDRFQQRSNGLGTILRLVLRNRRH